MGGPRPPATSCPQPCPANRPTAAAGCPAWQLTTLGWSTLRRATWCVTRSRAAASWATRWVGWGHAWGHARQHPPLRGLLCRPGCTIAESLQLVASMRRQAACPPSRQHGPGPRPQMKEIVNAGNLLPDALILRVIREHFMKASSGGVWPGGGGCRAVVGGRTAGAWQHGSECWRSPPPLLLLCSHLLRAPTASCFT